MRLKVATALAAAMAFSCTAHAQAAAPPIADLDVPQDKGPQHISTLVREFPVGGNSGWHMHAGVEIAYLIAGEMTLEQEGQVTRVLHPGDSFTVPRGVAHNGANIGNVPARLVITYLVDKDAPLRTPVSGH